MQMPWNEIYNTVLDRLIPGLVNDVPPTIYVSASQTF
jgi:hypothetical protein